MSAPSRSGLEMSAKAPLLGAGAGATPEPAKEGDGDIAHKPKFSDEQVSRLCTVASMVQRLRRRMLLVSLAEPGTRCCGAAAK